MWRWRKKRWGDFQYQKLQFLDLAGCVKQYSFAMSSAVQIVGVLIMQDCEIKKKTSYSVEVVNITWCLLGGKNSDRPFLTLMEMECPYSLEEDSTGFQLCDWIPLTEKTPSTPSLQNQFLKGDHGVTVETLFYLL